MTEANKAKIERFRSWAIPFFAGVALVLVPLAIASVSYIIWAGGHNDVPSEMRGVHAFAKLVSIGLFILFATCICAPIALPFRLIGLTKAAEIGLRAFRSLGTPWPTINWPLVLTLTRLANDFFLVLAVVWIVRKWREQISSGKAATLF